MYLREFMISRLIYPIADLYRGTSIMKKTRFLQKSQWWDKDRLREFQYKKLRYLIYHAYNKVPYYRKLFKEKCIHPSDVKCLDDLVKIPILKKTFVRKFKNDLVAANFRGRNLLKGRTGGSTGEPLQFYNDRNTMSWVWGAMNRYYEWTGMRIGESRYDIGGGSLGGYISKGRIRDTLVTIRRKLDKSSFFPIFNMNAKMAEEICKSSKSNGIRVIRGYPSGLYVLAMLVKSDGLNSGHIKIIQSTSERLYPHQRDVIENNLSANVYDQYGAGEVLAIAAQCEKKGPYHIFDEHVIVEDERTLEVKDGRVPAIITDLDNYAMPFIRYELGDVLNLKERECSCGRGLSTVGKIEGRTHDFLVAFDGRPIPGEFIPHLFQKVTGFDRYFVNQLSETEIVVKIVKNDNYREFEVKQLTELMKDVLGKEMVIRFESVDVIELSKTGKLSFIKSEIKPRFP